MKNNEQEISIIQENLKGIKNHIIRKRALFLIRALQSGNVKLTSDKFGHARQTYYFWIRRLRKTKYNMEALLDISRKPKSNSKSIDQSVIDLAIQVRKDNYNAGAKLTTLLLKRDHGIEIHASTLGYIFRRKNISQQYRIPRKNSHTKRYALQEPLERVQTDTVNLGIVDNNGHSVKAYPVIDDCSRTVVVHIADEHSNYEATNGIKKFVEKFEMPQKIQTDNGVEFTSKYVSQENPRRKKKSVISGFEEYLREAGIEHKLIRPGTPELNGKVERFNQTLKRALEGKIKNGMSIIEIQTIVDNFVNWYNKIRPHSSLNNLTPYQRFHRNRMTKIAS